MKIGIRLIQQILKNSTINRNQSKIIKNQGRNKNKNN